MNVSPHRPGRWGLTGIPGGAHRPADPGTVWTWTATLACYDSGWTRLEPGVEVAATAARPGARGRAPDADPSAPAAGTATGGVRHAIPTRW